MTADGARTELVRFDRVERAVHWFTAMLVLALMLTGAVLYAGPLSVLVGRRALVRQVHVWCGLLVPLPLVFGIASRAGRGLRADLTTLNRWTADDRRWWRSARRGGSRLGKFNPGQKLNAAFVGGALAVTLMTGIVMRWFEPFPDAWRTGATFVHDWFALGLWVSVGGHVALALADPVALRAMIRGTVPAHWARTKRPGWHDALTGSGNPSEAAEAPG